MNRNFTRILVPTDFSVPSKAALALAKRMATTSGASLHLIHVLQISLPPQPIRRTSIHLLPEGIRESWWREPRPSRKCNSPRMNGRRFAAPSWWCSERRLGTSSIMPRRTTSTSS